MNKIVSGSNNLLVIKRTISTLVFLFVLYGQSALAAPCKYDFTMENWVKSSADNSEKQQTMMDMFSSCLPNDPYAQERIDYLVVESILQLSELDKEIQKPFLDYNLKMLLMNAKAGFASSQHNYASLHNADPKSLEFKLVPQSQKTFIYWTKMAASQAEPKAMFNLAIRCADNDPIADIKYDPEMAYRLFLLLVQNYSDYPVMKNMLEYAEKEMDRLKPILGEQTINKIQKSLSTFDYKTLAPK